MIRPDSLLGVTAQSLDRHPIVAHGCVVAVSGGPDSVCLLHTICDIFRSRGSSAPLVVCHMNHGLRGSESDGDETFVRGMVATLAAQPGAPRLQLACTKVDVASRAVSQHENVEALARKLRYAWLAEQARIHSVRWVLTAHTLNDQAETTLFHILRGTGIRGLRGMRPRRWLADDIWLFRPWLTVEKAEILAYLNERGLPFRVDSSNQDQRFTRNRLRHDLLPKLQAEYNGRIQDALAGLAKHAARAGRLLDIQAKKALERAEKPRVEHLLIFETATLRRLSLEALQSLFAYVWRREGWPRGHMGSREWESLARWTHGQSAAIDLPDGIRAVKKRSVVQLGPRK
jgi:tRNA(Ile)-lysidine synthase